MTCRHARCEPLHTEAKRAGGAGGVHHQGIYSTNLNGTLPTRTRGVPPRTCRHARDKLYSAEELRVVPPRGVPPRTCRHARDCPCRTRCKLYSPEELRVVSPSGVSPRTCRHPGFAILIARTARDLDYTVLKNFAACRHAVCRPGRVATPGIARTARDLDYTVLKNFAACRHAVCRPGRVATPGIELHGLSSCPIPSAVPRASIGNRTAASRLAPDRPRGFVALGNGAGRPGPGVNPEPEDCIIGQPESRLRTYRAPDPQ
jgi:hypothetical protein